MEQIHINFVETTASAARQLLDMYGDLTVQNTLWAGTPAYNAVIDDTVLATVDSYVAAGLTAARLTDALYALEQVRGALTNALPALAVLGTV